MDRLIRVIALGLTVAIAAWATVIMTSVASNVDEQDSVAYAAVRDDEVAWDVWAVDDDDDDDGARDDRVAGDASKSRDKSNDVTTRDVSKSRDKSRDVTTRDVSKSRDFSRDKSADHDTADVSNSIDVSNDQTSASADVTHG